MLQAATGQLQQQHRGRGRGREQEGGRKKEEGRKEEGNIPKRNETTHADETPGMRRVQTIPTPAGTRCSPRARAPQAATRSIEGTTKTKGWTAQHAVHDGNDEAQRQRERQRQRQKTTTMTMMTREEVEEEEREAD